MRIKFIKILINGSKIISYYLIIDDILCENYFWFSFVILFYHKICVLSIFIVIIEV